MGVSVSPVGSAAIRTFASAPIVSFRLGATLGLSPSPSFRRAIWSTVKPATNATAAITIRFTKRLALMINSLRMSHCPIMDTAHAGNAIKTTPAAVGSPPGFRKSSEPSSVPLSPPSPPKMTDSTNHKRPNQGTPAGQY